MPRIAMHLSQSKDRDGDETALARSQSRKKYAGMTTNRVIADVKAEKMLREFVC